MLLPPCWCGTPAKNATGRHHNQGHQYENKWVIKRVEELDQRMRCLIMGNLIGTELLQPFLSIILS